MRPHAGGEGGDGHGGEDHALVAEDGLAGEDGEHLGDDAEEGQGEDVDLRVAEEPEEVLPQQGRATADGGEVTVGDEMGRPGDGMTPRHGEDVGAEVPVTEQHDQGAGEHRERDEDQDAGHQHVPGEDGHSEHGHARGAQIEDGGHQVHPGEDGREPGQHQGHDPDVTADAGRARGAGEWGVGHPAEAGRPAGHQEAQHHGDRPGEVEPVAQGVETGERHVGGADLQRHHVVGQATEGERPGEQIEHQAAVHGEQLVVLPEGEERRVGRRQLEPEEEGHDPGEVEQDDRGDHVAEADDLVVGRGQPLEDAGRAVVLVAARMGVDRSVTARFGRQVQPADPPRDRIPGSVAR